MGKGSQRRPQQVPDEVMQTNWDLVFKPEDKMFEFIGMFDNYEERKVDRFEDGKVCIIDTTAINDSEQPYETALSHRLYKGGKWIIVEMYDTKEEAQEGHNRWIKTMTSKKLPSAIKDVSSCIIASVLKGSRETDEIYERGNHD